MATDNNHLLPIKKTKKSSYKPLSKLNEDSLTELKRVDKPEYTNRVFFFNHASKARLMHNVNTWFRHHEHSLKMINRRQRAAYKMLARVQQDRHRARRELYKRRQQEMRENMQQLEMELLQRRVIQRFRRNAFQKMTARGLWNKSWTGKTLEVQWRQYNKVGITEEEEEEGVLAEEKRQENNTSYLVPSVMPGAVLNYVAIGASYTTQSQTSSSDLSGHERDCQHEATEDAETDKYGAECVSIQNESVSVRSNGLSTSERSNRTKHRSSKLERKTHLDVIPEIRSSTLSLRSDCPEGMIAGKGNDDVYDYDDMRATSSTPNSRVIEVSRHSLDSSTPYNPVTRTRKIAYTHHLFFKPDTICVSDQDPTSKAKTSPDSNSASMNHPFQPNQAPLNRYEPLPSISGDAPKQLTFENSVPDHHTSKENQATTPDPRNTTKRGKSLGGTPKNLPLSRGQIGDAESMSKEGRLKREGDKDGKSLAVRVRQERKEKSKRRSELLDSEPLTQYYRSSRGTLQPLLTKTERRQWGLPNGRRQYQQQKLLREEHKKELDRRSNIDSFFTRKFGHEKTLADHDTDSQEDGPESNHLQKLLNRMRQQSQVDAGNTAEMDKNPLDELAKCQYLRAYDWGSRDKRGERESAGHGEGEEEKMTSWTAAEDSLKAGFLALKLTHLL